MFIGRQQELSTLQDAYESPKRELVVLYGRRRIGKSLLVREFLKNKPTTYSFEAIEGAPTRLQIRQFAGLLSEQTQDTFFKNVTFTRWEDVLSAFTERVLNKQDSKKKTILFLDELQWMAAGRHALISLLKYFWDNPWKDQRLMLILCGSVASFMVKNVIRSRALYGRITQEMLLRGLPPADAAKFFKGKRSPEEILKYLLVFGGVPKYLEEIRLDRSFSQNLNTLCFRPNAPMLQEVAKIFFQQFREHRLYQRIAVLLNDQSLSLGAIGKKVGLPTGGGLRLYLENLENADILRSAIPISKGPTSKLKRYYLADEFLRFYFKYVEPNQRLIAETDSGLLFERITAKSLDPWMGLAFERFCIKNAMWLAKKMGFADHVLSAGPSFSREDKGYQVDLAFLRSDRVQTVCEIKFWNRPLTTKIIPEMQRKCERVPLPRGYTQERALISLRGADPALKDSGYFHHILTLNDLF